MSYCYSCSPHVVPSRILVHHLILFVEQNVNVNFNGNLPNNVTLTPVHSARNLGVIFDNNLFFSQRISATSKSCFHDIRVLRRKRNIIA